MPVSILADNEDNKFVITSGIYRTKSQASNELNNLSIDYKKFTYHIKSNNILIQSNTQNKLLNKFKSTKLIENETIKELYAGILIIVSLILFLITLMISVSLLVYILPTLILPILSIYYIMKKNFENYLIIDINSNELISEDYYDKNDDYKIVSVTTNIENDKLTVYTDELDAKWVYQRNRKDSSFSEEATSLLEEINTQDNAGLLLVKNKPNSDNKWKSEDNEWWVYETMN